MRRSMIYLMALVVCLFSGCEKGDEYEPSPRENFEALWKILDENYCFFSYKQVDWDEVHERYSPLITDTMSQIALFDTLANMTNELKDGHTNLVSQFNTSRYWDWYLDYPDNFDSKIQENYLGRDYAIAGGLEYTTLADGKVGYVYYGSFSSSAGENGLDYVLLAFKDCQGLIIGAPVHYASPAGAATAFFDRLFYSGSSFAFKPGAAVVSARRAGTTASLDMLNKYFLISQMPLVSSCYWNMVHGSNKSDVEKDEEGLQTMRQLGRNMAWMLKLIKAGLDSGISLPEVEDKIRTNFIR